MSDNYNVALDFRYIELSNSGLARFTQNIFINLINNCNYEKFNFLLILPPRQYCNEFLSSENNLPNKFKIIHWGKTRGLRWKLGIHYFDFNLYYQLRKHKIFIYINPYMDISFLPGIKTISTIHDLTFLKVNGYFNKFSRIKKVFGELRLIFTIFLSDDLLTVSKSTRKFLMQRYKFLPKKYKNKISKMNIVPNGITPLKPLNYKFNPILKNMGKLNYVLYVGDRRPHKNIPYLISLVSAIRSKMRENIILIIAGSKKYKNLSLEKLIKENKNYVCEYENPNDLELNFLYENAKCLFLLSKSEGFGIPIIEAGAKGKKLVLSNIEVFKEIAPKETLFLDMENKKNHSDKVIKYLKNDSYPKSQELLTKWSWSKSSLILKQLLIKKCR